jgi:thioredoxin-like negative regulator of GroEL
MPETITDTRMQEILDGGETCVVRIYANWAPAGQDAFRSVADAFDDVQFGEVDVDAHPDAVKAIDAESISIPTIVILSEGKEVDRQSGLWSEPGLAEWITEQTDSDGPSRRPSDHLP